MKLSGTLRALVVVTVSLLVVLPSSAYLLDEHFGVSLALDPGNAQTDTYQGQQTIPMLESSWTPTKNNDTVDYTVDDWFGSWDDDRIRERSDLGPTGRTPSGGEPFDVEALYFDDDQENLYFSVVTSADPPPGRWESRQGAGGTILAVTGDFAMDLGLNSPYVDGFAYDFGVNLNDEQRNSSGNASGGGSALGTGLYRTMNADWYLGTPSNAADGQGELTNFDPGYSGFAGSFLDDVTTDYYQYDFGGQQEGLYATYVIEMTIPRSSLPKLDPGDSVGMSWVMGCRNDTSQNYGMIRFTESPTVDHQQQGVPEPGTMVLVTLGLAGLGIIRKRRDRSS